jgi:hypothetical protein
MTRRSLTRGKPRGFGNNGLIQRIWARDSRNRLGIGYLRPSQNHTTPSRVKGPDPSLPWPKCVRRGQCRSPRTWRRHLRVLKGDRVAGRRSRGVTQTAMELGYGSKSRRVLVQSGPEMGLGSHHRRLSTHSVARWGTAHRHTCADIPASAELRVGRHGGSGQRATERTSRRRQAIAKTLPYAAVGSLVGVTNQLVLRLPAQRERIVNL